MIDKKYDSFSFFTEKVSSLVLDEITGGIGKRICADERKIRDQFFVGVLSAREEFEEINSSFQSRSKIQQLGIQVLVKKEELASLKLKLLPSCILYYRSIPSLKEQREHFAREFCEQKRLDLVSFGELQQNFGQEIQDFKVRVSKRYEEIVIDKSNKYGISFNKGVPEIDRPEIENVSEIIHKKEDFWPQITEKTKYSDLISEGSWKTFLTRSSRDRKFPNWRFEIQVTVDDYGEELSMVTVYWRNESPPNQHGDFLPDVYKTSLELMYEGAKLIPFKLADFEEDYKYDRTLLGLGINCFVEVTENKTLITTFVPKYKLRKLVTKQSKVPPKFDELRKNPFETLDSVLDSMKDCLNGFDRNLEDFLNKKEISLSEDNQKQVKREKEGFQNEIRRFELGIEVLKKVPEALEAFSLMNHAFSNSSKGYDSWRLFQIVFIVINIPDLVMTHFDAINTETYDKAELLFFPTGGGKTEAFLGIVVFNMFFDRLRGKALGVSSIIKYPLRLLSVQQAQRLADITAEADKIRAKHDKMKATERFSVGYYAGSNNSPNDVSPIKPEDNLGGSLDPEDLTRQFRKIRNCPYCKAGELKVEYRGKTNQLAHVCKNCDEDIIPFYMVDTEVFRFLPTVIVSTIDKFTALGFQKKFSSIAGNITGKCDLHGYSNLGECVYERACRCSEEGLYNAGEYENIAPSIIVQDELHLLVESLGIFNAHYESFFQHFVNELSPGDKNHLKVICATATLSNYKHQIWHLYLKDAIKFPEAHPDPDDSFYFQVLPNINRHYFGITPIGVTPDQAVQEIARHFRKHVYRFCTDEALFENTFGHLEESLEIEKVLKNYWVLLEYGQKKNQAINVCDALNSRINPALKEEEKYETTILTGDQSIEDVINVIDRLEEDNKFPKPDFIAATSLVSHGVDIDLLNFMTVLGVPLTMGEYIQASSRVGRKYPASIFMVFMGNREKDRSYFRYFPKFNELKDVLVEPVPIDRWVHNAVNRTIPGLIFGYILQHWSYLRIKQGASDLVTFERLRASVKNGLFDKGDLLSFLEKAYGLHIENNPTYKSKLVKLVDFFFDDYLESNLEGKEFISFVRKDFSALKSLRDTDISLELNHSHSNEPMYRGLMQAVYKHFPGSWFQFQQRGFYDVAKVDSWEGIPYGKEQVNTKRVLSAVQKVLPKYETIDHLRDPLTEQNSVILKPIGVHLERGTNQFYCRGCKKAFYSRDWRNIKCPACKRFASQLALVYHCMCGWTEPVKMQPCPTHGFDSMSYRDAKKEWACTKCNFNRNMFNKSCRSCGSKIPTPSQLGDSRLSIPRFVNYIELVTNTEQKLLDSFIEGESPDCLFLIIAQYLSLVKNSAEFDSLAANILDPSLMEENQRILDEQVQMLIGSGAVPSEEAAITILKMTRPELFISSDQDGVSPVQRAMQKTRTSRIEDIYKFCVEELSRRVINGYSEKFEVDLNQDNDFLNKFGLKKVTVTSEIEFVHVNYGFSRGRFEIPGSSLVGFHKDKNETKLQELQGKNKLYAIKYKTEGVVFDLSKPMILKWLIDNDLVEEERDNVPEDFLNPDQEALVDEWWVNNLKLSEFETFNPISGDYPVTSAIYRLLHTISHSLLRNSEHVGGLSKNSLSEYILPATASIIIYSHNTHENVLGVFETIVKNSLKLWLISSRESLSSCINDPVCIEGGYGQDDKHACFDCSQIHEISCVHMNHDLDRRYVIGYQSENKTILPFWKK